MEPVHQGGEEALSLTPKEGTAKAANNSDTCVEKVVELLTLPNGPIAIIDLDAAFDIRQKTQSD